ncbi:MAG: phospholipase C, phosphocholine-specific [Catenulisporales bacterium]|nr:phospholipase C, phosphocholine-specific [Catenulisporales bacterium]
MTAVNRRRFLQITGAATTATSLPMLTASIARAAAVQPNRRTGTIADIEHVVILMQENRSFDHYFGTLNGVRGFGDPRPARLPNGKAVWHQADAKGNEILPWHPDGVPDLGLKFLDGLDHSWNGGHQAWNHGDYDQWIPAKGPGTMAHFQRADIPFHFALADAFTVCDAYHCSLMTSTDPNRYYLWTGFTGNDGKGGGPVLNNAEAGYDWTTYPERLQAAGVSWKIYQDAGNGLDADGSWGWTDDAFIGNYGDTSVLYFHQYQNAKPGDPLYDNARTGTNAAAGQGYFDVLAQDVKNGTLPQVSWITAPEAFSEHPNWPANYGAWYIAQVLDVLTSDPELWSKTALFITYDENDGFFDHVVPPFAPGGPAGGASTADASTEYFPGGNGFAAGSYGLGQRVPMFVVSPWSRGGWVNSQTFDHTSVIRFLEQRFGVREPNISAWRRAVCGDLTSAFDFGRRESAVPALPSTGSYVPPDHARHPSYPLTLPASPAMPKQEPKPRPARALPYDLAADGRLAGGALTVAFASHGRAGANFIVTSTTDPTGPWSYTVGAGQHLTGTWRMIGAYDFDVRSANGFLREFKGGSAEAGPEVVAAHVAGSRELKLTITNSGDAAVTLTITDAYCGDRKSTQSVRPGQHATHVVQAQAAGGWYDVTVTSDHDAAYVRRFAGHVEDGKPSVSDPAIITH